MTHPHRPHPFLLGILLPAWILLAQCQKQFDEPPVYTGSDLQQNMSIGALRALHTMGQFEQVMSDGIIAGVVVADDRHDNFYKSLVLQDSTGGITIRMDGYSLYNRYPVGSKLFIRLRGLWLGDYGKMVQLGGGVDKTDPLSPDLKAIPQPLFDRFVVKANGIHSVIPIPATIEKLADSMQSRLVRLDQVEFVVADTGKTYADAINKQPASHTIRNCGIGSIYVRTSGYASFSNAQVPRGNGSITGVYTVFQSQKQLLLRDTSDVQMNGLRCSGTGPKSLFAENFETITPDSILQLKGWQNIAETGERHYLGKRASNNHFAELSAFATRKPAVISWLISPAINLDHSSNEVLSFSTKDGFDNGAVLQVLVSMNYDGGATPWKAKWVALTAKISKGSVAGMAAQWQPSGNISLKAFAGNIHLAFRYEGNDPPDINGKLTTTFRIDDVKIAGN